MAGFSFRVPVAVFAMPAAYRLRIHRAERREARRDDRTEAGGGASAENCLTKSTLAAGGERDGSEGRAERGGAMTGWSFRVSPAVVCATPAACRHRRRRAERREPRIRDGIEARTEAGGADGPGAE